MAVKSPSGSYGLASWSNPVSILAVLLIGSALCVGLARADQPAAADAWSEQRIETAFHDVLAHGDLSDIGFLARTLGLELEVVKWQQPSILPKGLLSCIGMFRLEQETDFANSPLR
jgi:hypothetical protein